MSELHKQFEFTKSLVRLLTWCDVNGYQVTLGEAWRPPETAAAYAMKGMGIANSLHTHRLAIDLNIFFKDVWLTSVDDVKPIGDFWESMSTPELPHCWGGNFSNPDTDHFSFGQYGCK